MANSKMPLFCVAGGSIWGGSLSHCGDGIIRGSGGRGAHFVIKGSGRGRQGKQHMADFFRYKQGVVIPIYTASRRCGLGAGIIMIQGVCQSSLFSQITSRLVPCIP